MSEILHLNDVVDYQRDIAPFRYIEIHAGPGAGKNTFIEDLAKGALPNAPKMKVLLITSRRAKVDETFTTYENPDGENLKLFQNRIGIAWDILDEKGNSTLATAGNTVCTSAFIAGYIKNVFREDDRRTHLWDMYDLIAIDEVHSMMLDATYQDAPFHLYDLLNHYLERCVNTKFPKPVCKHIILMTGTPEPLQSFIPIGEVSQWYLNKMQQCVNIQPQNVYFIEHKDVINHLKSLIELGKRGVYFGNRIDQIKEIFYNNKLPKDKMVLSFSNEEKRKELEENDREVYSNMMEAEDEIKTHFQIPDKFSVLLTTSRYREGININDNIDELIIETHNKSEAIQMAGRIRSGVKDLYIVVDAKSYPTDYSKEMMEQKLARMQIWGSTQADDPPIKDTNGKIDKRCFPLNYMLNEIPENQLQKFIELIEEKFPYIKYSYLYGCFMLYDLRIAGMNYNERQNRIWDTGTKNKELQRIVQEWFPDSNIYNYKSTRETKYEASWKLWNDNHFMLNVVYEKKVIDDFKAKLSEIWGYKQLNKLLSMFSKYECVQAGKKNKGMKFRISKTS